MSVPIRSHTPTATNVIVAVVIAAVVLLAVVLLTLSVLVPSATLAARLFGAAGEARTGAFAQDLAANLDTRLRFMGVILLALCAGLTIVRRALLDLVHASLADVRGLRLTWPSTAMLLSLGLPTLAAVGIRSAFLSQPMRYDEALTFNEFASRPLYYGLSYYPDPNNHLLNTLLMHVGYVVLGNQPWVLRLPAFVAGVLLAPATLALTWQLFEPRAAVLAATLVAVSSYLVEYSTNARGYTLQALSFVVLLGLVIFGACRGSLSALLLVALVSALGVFAVPTMLYGVVIAATWLLVELRRQPASPIHPTQLAAVGLIFGLVVALAYLPVSIVSGPDKLAFNRFVVPLDLGELAIQLPASLRRTFELWNRDIPLPLAAVLAVGFVLASPRVPLAVISFGVCLAFILLQRVAPFERVWLFLLPLYFAIASGGLARFVDGRWLALAFGAVLGFFTVTSGSILSSSETGVFPDAEAVAHTLAPRLMPDDAVVTQVPASLPELQYYFPRSGVPTSVLVRAPAEAGRIWLVAPTDRASKLPGWSAPVEVERFSSSTLFELSRSP